jgi:hypothetical protein
MHRRSIEGKLHSSEMALHCYRLMLSVTVLFYCFHHHHHHHHSHSAILNFIKTLQAVFRVKNAGRKAGRRTKTTLYDFILYTSYKNFQHVRDFLSEFVEITFKLKYIYLYTYVHTLLSNGPRYQKNHFFLAGSQASPVCPSDKNNV